MATDLLTLFAPLVYLHTEDALRPCSVDWLLDRAALLRPSALEKEPATDDYVLSVGEIHPKSLIAQKSEGKNSGWTPHAVDATDYTLYLPDLQVSGFSPNQPPAGSSALGEPLVNGACQATCYAHLKENTDTYDLIYMFCYALNGAVSSLSYAGVHIGDWEHIVVRLNKQSKILQAVYFARHSFGDGQWYDPGEIELQDGRIVAYAAAYSHASYPHAGDWPNPTLGKLAPDKCKRGPQWKTWHKLVDVGSLESPTAGNEWLQYNGRWGGQNYDWSFFQVGVFTGLQTPTYQRWWREEPPQ